MHLTKGILLPSPKMKTLQEVRPIPSSVELSEQKEATAASPGLHWIPDRKKKSSCLNAGLLRNDKGKKGGGKWEGGKKGKKELRGEEGCVYGKWDVWDFKAQLIISAVVLQVFPRGKPAWGGKSKTFLLLSKGTTKGSENLQNCTSHYLERVFPQTSENSLNCGYA